VLSERDARVLRSMEQQLAASDPRFAATMSTAESHRRRSRVAGAARATALTLAVMLGVFGFWVGAPGSGVLLLLIAGGTVAVRRGWAKEWWRKFRTLGE
jgi:hypothetical protein